MEAKAVAKYVRMSSSKLKPVADLVRGKDLNEALTILKFTVAVINCNQGPTMKRWRPGAQGRAGMILKRTSNIYVTLKEKEAPVKAVKEAEKEEVR